MLNEINETILNTFREAFHDNYEYRVARLKACETIKDQGEYFFSKTFSAKFIKELTTPNVYGWINEKPPFEWYIQCLITYFLSKDTPYSLKILLMKAANYYGDYDLVVMLASEKKEISKEIDYNKREQFAKALKNSGRFQDARNIYRKLILDAQIENNEILVAYYLMLYAKLCNDYQQRQGWYIAFHQIANERISKMKFTNDKVNSKLIRRKEICIDSFAKAIYPENPYLGETIYGQLFNDHNKIDDGFIRMKAHFFESRIYNLLKSNESHNFITLEKYLEEFYNLTFEAIKLENFRASNVRMVQFLKLSRLIEEWCAINHFPIKSEMLSALKEGEAIEIANAAKERAGYICDWKTAAFCEFEKAKRYSPNYRIPKHYVHIKDDFDSAIKCLIEANKILLSEKKERLSYIYHDVLVSLADIYNKIGNIDQAGQFWTEAYNYCRDLVKAVTEDEEEINRALRYKTENKTDHDEALIGEFKPLSIQELELIKQRLTIDYKLLLERMVDIGEHVQSVQRQELMIKETKFKELSNEFKYHDLIQKLTPLKDMAKTIDSSLGLFEKVLEQWKKEETRLNRTSRFELLAAIDQIIKSDMSYLTLREFISFDTSPFFKEEIFVKFNTNWLRVILFNLIFNAYKIAEQNNVDNLKMKISIILKDKLIYLKVEDNAGSVQELDQFVLHLNKNTRAQALNEMRKGKGLYIIKDIVMEQIGINEKWEVIKIDNQTKALVIPLMYRD